MKKLTWGMVAFLVLLLLGINCFGLSTGTYAEEEGETTSENTSNAGTSISLTPVTKILQIASNSVYEDKLTVNNDGDSDMKIEVYAAPYSYVYSESEDIYKLGFNNDNNFTQIVRWISFDDTSGNWVKKANYTIAPKQSIDVKYRIATPDSIPGGGQYAVIFAHTLTSSSSGGGIRTEASPGMVVYGRSVEGETIVKSSISDLKVELGVSDGTTVRNSFYASAKVKNEGNVDFNAIGNMTIKNIFGSVVYETPVTSGRVSIIPETELIVSDEWKEPPFFGLYNVTWTVTVGDNTETISKMIFVNMPLFLIVSIILLTIIIIWIIMGSRRRKERKSRLAV
ncbi:hypothetical protein IKD82_03290 [Candidatus Saccharibacteria bacterium]|nr:hypothetical protein [Candidatus Saccharibacteria bacterium]